MIRFIDEYRNRFSVEFICQTLNTHREGIFLSSRGYRQSKARGLSARSLRDAALVEHSHDVHFQKLRRLRHRRSAAELRSRGTGLGAKTLSGDWLGRTLAGIC